MTRRANHGPQRSEIIERLPTYVNRWESHELDLLRRPQVAQAIRIPLERNGVTIEQTALVRLIDGSAGYPYFVQRYASAAWTAHSGGSITLGDVEGVIPRVRILIEKLFYREPLENLSARERIFAIALAALGPGAHELRAVASALGVGSSALGSIRTQLIKKGIIFSPRAGYLQFRIPLAERYIIDHRDDDENADVIAYRTSMHEQKNIARMSA